MLSKEEKQSKEIEHLKRPKYIIDCKTNEIKKKLTNDFVSKDKIKAKIEEVEQWELYNMKIPKLSTLDERLGAKIGIKHVLQSLLERMFGKKKQTTFIYCPKCNNELVKNGNLIKDTDFVYYKCSKCGYESKWDFEAPCPILLEED